MKKSQKRQKRLVLVAMALMIGLVAGMGAMTYSKYITTGSTNQTATAAKWGFVVNVDASQLFGTDYKLVDGSYATYIDDDGGVAVNAAGIVVAPGTKGSMTFSASGTAEVLARITVTADFTSEITDGNGYYPIIWTLEKTGQVDPIATGKLEDVINDIGTSLPSATITPGNSATGAGVYTLSWAWPLETGVDDNAKAINNIKDTVIGMKANNAGIEYDSIKDLYVGNATIGSVFANQAALDNVVTTITFNISINIEQIQS